jgi:antitoxin VapB
MGLNIKNAEVERLAAEVAAITGETKTEAIRRALIERLKGLSQAEPCEERERRVTEWLEREVWPNVPKVLLGRRMSKEEWEEALGYGPHGV